MVTGEPPYRGTPLSVMTAHVNSPVPDPRTRVKGLSDGLADVLRMMMAKDRRDRYRLPDDLVIDLKKLLEGKKPLLARSDVQTAVLTDAADYEEEVEPEVVTREEMRRLKREIGWGRHRRRLSWMLTALVIALAWLAIVFSLLFVLGIIHVG